MEKISAYEIYEAAFDSACEPFPAETHEDFVSYVIRYADAVWSIRLSEEVAEKIVTARENYIAKTWGGKRPGAGRKKETPPDATRRGIAMTDEEEKAVRELLQKMRS